MMMWVNFFKKAVLWPVIFVCFLSIAGVPSSFGDQPAGAFSNGDAEIAGQNPISKIVSILAIRGPGGKALGKATEKLSAMNNRDLSLIASLCDRISADGVTAGADIAFSLITAMIVLS